MTIFCEREIIEYCIHDDLKGHLVVDRVKGKRHVAKAVQSAGVSGGSPTDRVRGVLGLFAC